MSKLISIYMDSKAEKISEIASLVELSAHGLCVCTYSDLEGYRYLHNYISNVLSKKRISLVQISNNSSDLYEQINNLNTGQKLKIFLKQPTNRKIVLSLNLNNITYSKLNLLRDFFLKMKYSAILWTSESSLITLSTHAPDFWRIVSKIIRFSYPKTLNLEGLQHVHNKKYYAALSNFDHALSISSNYIEALNNKALVLMDLSKNSDALSNFTIALNVNKLNPIVLNNKGVLLYKEKKYEYAISCFDNALKSINHSRSTILRYDRYYDIILKNRNATKDTLMQIDREKYFLYNEQELWTPLEYSQISTKNSNKKLHFSYSIND